MNVVLAYLQSIQQNDGTRPAHASVWCLHTRFEANNLGRHSLADNNQQPAPQRESKSCIEVFRLMDSVEAVPPTALRRQTDRMKNFALKKNCSTQMASDHAMSQTFQPQKHTFRPQMEPQMWPPTPLKTLPFGPTFRASRIAQI
jgi:hypothetical protein